MSPPTSNPTCPTATARSTKITSPFNGLVEGKILTGNHRFSHEKWDFPVNFPVKTNQMSHVTSGRFPHRAARLQALLLQRAAQRGLLAHLEPAAALAAQHRPERHGTASLGGRGKSSAMASGETMVNHGENAERMVKIC